MLRINWVIMMLNSNDAVVLFRVWMRAPGSVFDRVVGGEERKRVGVVEEGGSTSILYWIEAE